MLKRCRYCNDYITGIRSKSPTVIYCSKECSKLYWLEQHKDEKTPWLKLRFEILARDNFACQYCGRTSAKVELQIDHIHPRAKGGTNNKENLITACKYCNIGKSDTLLAQYLIDNLQNR